MQKPKRLKQGDTIGIISPSWGGPSLYPHIYDQGIKTLQDLGFSIKEFPSARSENEYLYNNPEFRANDINSAFQDHDVDGVITSIGGDDSIRILPYIDKSIIQSNPKFFMGYSDTTTLLTYLNQLGIVTFHGPTIMSGLSQFSNLGQSYQNHIKEIFFGTPSMIEYPSYSHYHEAYPERQDTDTVGTVNQANISSGRNRLQGSGTASGQLYGGCIETLEWMKGTKFWPSKDFFAGKILFFETSEEKPSVEQVKGMLRNYGMQGIFNATAGILFGRARSYSYEEKQSLNRMIVQIVQGEFGCSDIPIITGVDFGHTDPQIILPLGIHMKIDCEIMKISLLENPFLD